MQMPVEEGERARLLALGDVSGPSGQTESVEVSVDTVLPCGEGPVWARPPGASSALPAPTEVSLGHGEGRWTQASEHPCVCLFQS